MLAFRTLLLMLLAAAPAAAGGTSREPARFVNEDVGLAGTLYLPRGSDGVPGVVLVHGSGPEDRGGMKGFAKSFARMGIAALAYDKRGVGESEGDPDDWRYFDLHDLAGDAAAAARFLADHPRVDPERIGFFGASQGGWVVPLAAKKFGRAAFMVQLSASVSTVAEDRLFERQARLRTEGFDDEEVAEVHAMHRIDHDVTRSGERFDEYVALWREHESKRWFRRVYLAEDPIALDDPFRVWQRTVLDFDPLPILEELSVPTLWLFGDPSHDRFGPVALSVERVEALRRSGKPYEVRSYPGTDHGLRPVGGKRPGGKTPWQDDMSAWLAAVLER